MVKMKMLVMSFLFGNSLIKEVRDALLTLDRKKSPGADHLEPGLFKCAAHLIAVSVAHIFNITSVPKAWKSTYVLLLHKGGGIIISTTIAPFQFC